MPLLGAKKADGPRGSPELQPGTGRYAEHGFFFFFVSSCLPRLGLNPLAHPVSPPPPELEMKSLLFPPSLPLPSLYN